MSSLEAWRQICKEHEPNVKSRYAGQLLELLSWDFSGDAVARQEAFERQKLKYERSSGERMSDAIACGIILRQLPDGAGRESVAGRGLDGEAPGLDVQPPRFVPSAKS